jgi:hypothetical protein
VGATREKWYLVVPTCSPARPRSSKEAVELQKLNIDVFFGTMERPNEKPVDVVLLDPQAGKYIKGAGFQR